MPMTAHFQNKLLPFLLINTAVTLKTRKNVIKWHVWIRKKILTIYLSKKTAEINTMFCINLY